MRSVHEIESACSTLLEECEMTDIPRRRQLATRMLLRLLDRHTAAMKFVEVALEVTKDDMSIVLALVLTFA